MKTVIITGASQGIGYELSKLLVKKNKYNVYGLSRSSFDLEGVTHISCDVTNKDSVKDAINKIYNKTKRIDIIVNNAGMGISGSIEHTSDEDMRKIFDVNFFGSVNVIQEAIKYLKLNKGSKIINLGSVAGPLAIPFQAFYSATKSAIETLSNALSNELKPYNIYVTSILPGDTKTNFTKNRVKNPDISTDYEARVDKSISLMERDEQNGMKVSYVTNVIYKVIKRKKPPLKKTIGFKYKVFLFLNKILPGKLVNSLIGKIYGFSKD